jgi:hypothetical protein
VWAAFEPVRSQATPGGIEVRDERQPTGHDYARHL